MSINAISQNYNPKPKISFTAKSLASYQIQKNDFVTIYQLEKSDLPFISRFIQNLHRYFIDKKINDYAHCQVMEESFNAAEKILSSNEEKKSKILLAAYNSKPCGILIGNVEKRNPLQGNIVYSSRKNRGKNETELDWITTWNCNPDKKLHNIGKVIMAEYFNLLPKDKFKQVYVRSEIPELSCATEFYKSVGFKEIYNNRDKKREKIIKNQTNKYIIGNCDNPNDYIIPMLASKSQLTKITEKLFKKFKRKELMNISETLN